MVFVHLLWEVAHGMLWPGPPEIKRGLVASVYQIPSWRSWWGGRCDFIYIIKLSLHGYYIVQGRKGLVQGIDMERRKKSFLHYFLNVHGTQRLQVESGCHHPYNIYIYVMCARYPRELELR